jgi:microsomal epoxide hydrolase
MEFGFRDGFISHGCNLGGWISQEYGRHYPTCKGLLLTFCPIMEAEGDLPKEISELERAAIPRGEDYMSHGTAYLREHGTRPSTVGLVLSSSPIALLAWVAEKFLEWSDTDPSNEDILTLVSLFWLTETVTRSLYPYREFVTVRGPPRLLGPDTTKKQPPLDSPERYIKTPVGFSWFPKVLIPTPVAWVKVMTNLVWSRIHSKVSSGLAF